MAVEFYNDNPYKSLRKPPPFELAMLAVPLQDLDVDVRVTWWPLKRDSAWTAIGRMRVPGARFPRGLARRMHPEHVTVESEALWIDSDPTYSWRGRTEDDYAQALANHAYEQHDTVAVRRLVAAFRKSDFYDEEDPDFGSLTLEWIRRHRTLVRAVMRLKDR
jgi:hypothetical protein